MKDESGMCTYIGTVKAHISDDLIIFIESNYIQSHPFIIQTHSLRFMSATDRDSVK